MRVFLAKYGKKWDRGFANRTVGKTPLEAAAAIVEDYGLPFSSEELLDEVSPIFSER